MEMVMTPREDNTWTKSDHDKYYYNATKERAVTETV